MEEDDIEYDMDSYFEEICRVPGYHLENIEIIRHFFEKSSFEKFNDYFLMTVRAQIENLHLILDEFVGKMNGNMLKYCMHTTIEIAENSSGEKLKRALSLFKFFFKITRGVRGYNVNYKKMLDIVAGTNDNKFLKELIADGVLPDKDSISITIENKKYGNLKTLIRNIEIDPSIVSLAIENENIYAFKFLIREYKRREGKEKLIELIEEIRNFDDSFFYDIYREEWVELAEEIAEYKIKIRRGSVIENFMNYL